MMSKIAILIQYVRLVSFVALVGWVLAAGSMELSVFPERSPDVLTQAFSYLADQTKLLFWE